LKPGDITPTILFVIVRSKNYNTVCVEANVVDSKVEKVENYFLVIDPAFVETTTLTKEEFTREQLTYHEQQIYGITKQKEDAECRPVYTFNFLPSSYEFTVNPETSEAEMTIGGEKATLQKLYLLQQDRFVGAAKTKQVILYGAKGKTAVTETIAIE
jgi:hypothetical protein